jgi:hypothetical protein
VPFLCSKKSIKKTWPEHKQHKCDKAAEELFEELKAVKLGTSSAVKSRAKLSLELSSTGFQTEWTA